MSATRRKKRLRKQQRHLVVGVDQKFISRASSLIESFEGTQADSAGIFNAAAERFQDERFGDDIAFLLFQLDLKHLEFAKQVLHCFRVGHFTAGAALSRSLCEGAITLFWAMRAPGPEEQYRRLLAILAKEWRDEEDAVRAKKKDESPAQQAAGRQRVVEWRSTQSQTVQELLELVVDELDLPRFTGVRNLAQEADHSMPGDEFLEGHYGNFAENSKLVHTRRAGPARLHHDLENDEISIYTQGQHLIGASAAYYGLYYAVLSHQCCWLLAGQPSSAQEVKSAYAKVAPTCAEMLDEAIEHAEAHPFDNTSISRFGRREPLQFA